MNKIFYFILLCFLFSACGQQNRTKSSDSDQTSSKEIVGTGALFWGIPLGSNMAYVKNMVSKKGNGEIGLLDGTDDVLLCEGFDFAGKPGCTLAFSFYEDQFCRGIVYINSSSDAKIFSLYYDLQRDLISKYGDCLMHTEQFTRPYFQGDGYEVQALQMDKAYFSSIWLMQGLAITLKLENRIVALLTYEDPELNEKRVESLKLKNAEDL